MVPLGLRIPDAEYEGPPEFGRRRRRRGRWVPDEEDLEEYLGELEAEIAAVRREMEAAREARTGRT